MASPQHGFNFTVAGNSIGGLLSVTPPKSAVKMIETTASSDASVQRIPEPLVDNGLVTVVCNYLVSDTAQVALIAAKAAGSSVACVFYTNDKVTAGGVGTGHPFTAYCQDVQIGEVSAASGKQNQITFTLAITGALGAETAAT